MHDLSGALRMCKISAIEKTATKTRGLNAGDSFRCILARALAQQYTNEFRAATSAYNYGISVHSGTYSIIHLLRSYTYELPNQNAHTIDGMGAFD